MWELDHKEGWALKNWCLWTVVLEKTPESPLDCKEINPVSPKGNQPCIFIGRTVAEAEAPILWPPDAKSQFIGKDPDAGKDGGQRRRAWQKMRWLDGITDSMDMGLSAAVMGSQSRTRLEWLSSSRQLLGAKVLEFQLQHQSFQWIFRVDFL